MRTGWVIPAVLAVLLSAFATSAVAAPVTINFESGAAVGSKVTGQYGAPGGFPAGPVFRDPATVGFDAGCTPPTLIQATATRPAFSGFNTVELDGCVHGEFYPTGAFLSLGYTAKSVEFQLAETGSFLSPDEIVITAFRADKSIASQELTSLPAQAGPAYKGMIVSSAAYDIAFVTIERGTPFTGTSITGVSPSIGQSTLLLDDLTYDPPAAPPDSSFVIATSPNSLRLAAGTETDVTVPITWVNNPDPSGSPVSLEVTAPPGVTATVAPNPTTTGTATVHLVAAKDAPLGNVSLKVDGFVDKGTPAEKSATTSLPLTIAAPWGLNQPPNATVAGCATTTTGLRVFAEAGFNDPIEVTVYAPEGVRITSLAGVAKNSGSAQVTRTAQNGELLLPITFTADRSHAPAAGSEYQVITRAVGFSPVSAVGKIDIQRGSVTSVLSAGALSPLTSVRAAMLRRPGTKVELRGAGFCPGSTVRFGASGSSGTPSSIAPDGRSLVVEVPRGAVSGPVTLDRPDDPLTGRPAAALDPLPNLDVTDFRSTFGFRFENKGQAEPFTWSQFTNAFGEESLFVQVDVCAAATLGVAHCPIPTSIPDPFAWVVVAALEGKGKNGLCYGISRTVGDLESGAPLTPFTPFGAKNANALDGPDGPAAALRKRIGERHLTQFGTKVITAQVADVLGGQTPAKHAATIRARAEAELTNGNLSAFGGRPPIVSIYDAGAGHALPVYDIDDLGGDAYALIVADPNIPFDAADAASVSKHNANLATSRIIVDPAKGIWSYAGLAKPEGDKKVPWGRTIGPKTIEILPGSLTYDPKPRLPDLLTAISAIVLASDGSRLDQVTDDRGRTLIGADGLGQSGPKAIPKGVVIGPTDVGEAQNPIAVLPRGGTYDIAAERRGRAGGRVTVVDRGLEVSATTAAGGAAGGAATTKLTDTVHVDGKAREARLSPGAGGAATLTLGGGGHVAALETHGHKGASDALRLLPGGAIQLAHSGAATSATLVLTAPGTGGLPATARVPLGTLRPGERIALTPDWRRLAGATITLSRRRGGASRRQRIRTRGAAAALRAPAVGVRVTGRRLKVTAKLQRAGKSPWTTAGATVAVLRGRRVVGRARLQATDGAVRKGRATLTWTTKRLAAGSYRVLVLASASAGARTTSSDAHLVSRGTRVR